jgi:hypothetical protein
MHEVIYSRIVRTTDEDHVRVRRVNAGKQKLTRRASCERAQSHGRERERERERER